MSFDHTSVLTLIFLFTAFPATFFLSRLVRSRDVTSVFANTGALEQTACTRFALFSGKGPTDLGNGLKQLRPSWQARLIWPVLAATIIAIVDLSPLFSALGHHAQTVTGIAHSAMGAALGYLCCMTLFHQRVVWGHGVVATYGLDMRRRVRPLNDLKDMPAPGQRPVTKLHFARNAPLSIPRGLAHRDQFKASMRAWADHNVNNGVIVPMCQLRSRVAG